MKKYRKQLMAVLFVIFIVSSGMYGKQLLDNAAGDDSYESARQMAASQTQSAETQPESTVSSPAEEETVPSETVYVPAPQEPDEHMLALKELDPTALRTVNPDVVGWILLPGTKIDYPIVQGEDNQHYLDFTWEGHPNSAGAIFLESTNRADMTEFHTIIYGHNMANRSMFASIRDYVGQAFWETHPYVYLITTEGIFRYEVYASYEARVDSSTYQLGMTQENTKQDFLDMTLSLSVIDTGITPAVTDRILTLSTCSGMGYSTRWVVHARLPMIPA